MTIKTTFLLFLYSVITFAQGSGKDVQVEYQAFFNTESPMKMHTTLYISNNVAVYQEKYTTKENWTEKAKPDNNPPGSVTVVSNGVADDDYYRIDRNKKELLFYGDIMSTKFLVKDNFANMQWTITEDTKKVAGLTCIKATTDFRGRQWIAWFAPEIPLAFGPWKLHGLPGLILEAYDSTNRYTMKALKVEYKNSDMVAKDFSKIYATKNSKPITYRQFMDEKKEATENMNAEMDQRLKAMGATVTRDVVPRSGEELKFEWEAQ